MTASTPCRSRVLVPQDHRLADPLRGEQRVDLVAGAGEADDAELHALDDLVVLDQRVGQQPLAHLGQPRGSSTSSSTSRPTCTLLTPAEAERRQRALDRLALRVEDPGLRPDQHARPHGAVRSSQAANGSPASIS